MKKNISTLSIIFTICFFCLFTNRSYSKDNPSFSKSRQQPSDTSQAFVKLPKLTKFYSKDELNKLPKLELLNIYKSRLSYLLEILPFISLHPVPGATFHDMAIPQTDANVAHLEKEHRNKQEFITSLNETLDDVIPYSEKANIVWSILYFDEMIKKSDYTGSSKGK